MQSVLKEVLMVTRGLEVEVEVMERAAAGSETESYIQCSKNDDADPNPNHPLSSYTAVTEVIYESDPLTPSPRTTKTTTTNKIANTIVNPITKTTTLP